MSKFLIPVILLTILFVSCNKDDEPAEEQPVTMMNVSYGSSSQQAMDIYLPVGRSTTATKVMIMIHGGAWNAGDKSDFDAYVDSMKRREPSYAIFNINYRLAIAPIIFPAQEQDIKTAVEFIYNKRTEYNISDKFVLVGASAGAHLALLQAYKYTTPVKPKAIIDFFGPTDLIDLYNTASNPFVQPLLESVTGGTPTTANALYTQSSPINFISGQTPPTMILQGGADVVVPPSQSSTLNNKLSIAGVSHEYVFYPAESHGWVGANLTDSFNKIQAFLAAYVQ